MAVNHPLEGKLEASIRCMDMAARVKLWRHRSAFIFDPNNKTNRPVKGIHDNATIYWPLYPEKLRQMFTKAFTAGLNEIQANVSRSRMDDVIFQYDEWNVTVFLWCTVLFMMKIWKQRCSTYHLLELGKAVQVPNKIIIGKNLVLLNQNTKLLHHHVYDDFDMDTVVGSVVQNPKNPHSGEFGMKITNWTYQKADGTQIPGCTRKNSWDCKRCKDYIS